MDTQRLVYVRLLLCSLATESDSVNDIFIVNETKFDNEDYWKATLCSATLIVSVWSENRTMARPVSQGHILVQLLEIDGRDGKATALIIEPAV
jgi:hypothetical protein